MELLTGLSVFDVYKASGVMPWRRVVHIIRGACSSLAEAHSLGIIHRDLKPENLHLERRGDDADYVKVLDFGIARILESSVLDNTTLTRAGQMVGTFDYMPPEQIIGESAAQSDIFTLGVVMYELCSGRRPYGETKAPAAQLAAVLAGPPPLLDQIPDKLARVIARCIECDPDKRYADAGELLAALAPFVEGAEPPTERARPVRRNAPVPPPLPATLPTRPTPPGQSALMSPSRQKQMTLPGVQPSIARGSRGVVEILPRVDSAPRLASGTAPISDQPPVTNPFAEKLGTTNATGVGLSSFDAPNWRVVMLAVVFAAALIVLGLLV
jgi:serine/threonine-protein kinase